MRESGLPVVPGSPARGSPLSGEGAAWSTCYPHLFLCAEIGKLNLCLVSKDKIFVTVIMAYFHFIIDLPIRLWSYKIVNVNLTFF